MLGTLIGGISFKAEKAGYRWTLTVSAATVRDVKRQRVCTYGSHTKHEKLRCFARGAISKCDGRICHWRAHVDPTFHPSRSRAQPGAHQCNLVGQTRMFHPSKCTAAPAAPLQITAQRRERKRPTLRTHASAGAVRTHRPPSTVEQREVRHTRGGGKDRRVQHLHSCAHRAFRKRVGKP
eukprot:SAG11_NODE_1297_length_5269_cov_3.432302_7_plen_179_part_00